MAELETYRAKRNFDVTPEPEAKVVEAGGDRLSFCVQKHAARRLHYDFRLEHEGVLLSWAVTKGPSVDPADKRLAVRTEDHPLDYGDFEGVIPEGNYGAGTVMLWDQGWWEPLHDIDDGLKKGKLHFRLHGARMEGGWALVRMRGSRKGDAKRENWLLIKESDDVADDRGELLLNKFKRSVSTGRKMDEIAKGVEAVPEPVEHAEPLPRFRKVQLATLRDEPPEGEAWRHEAKFDGYRCLMAVGKGGVRLYTRNGKDWSDRFGALCQAADALPCDAALIDGEVIAGDGGGDFSALQAALKEGGDLTFYAFDCLHLDGNDLADRPLTERREALEGVLDKVPPRGAIRLSPFIEGSGADVLDAMCRAGGEGIVSKRADAKYRAGRGTSWIKTKCVRRAEFVIGGWTESDKVGRPFSSLILGSYEGGQLVYRGRVGTGFDEDDFDTLSKTFKKNARKAPPFDDLPAEAKRKAQWVKPRLVAEVQYAEFTADGMIRHGVFLGLREDKPAMTVSAKAEEAEGKDLKLRGVRISSPDRVVYPNADLTKGDVARHYDAVAERFLEHAGHRPVSLVRCPDGTQKQCFFQKHAGKGFPDSVGRVAVEESSGDKEDYIYFASPEAVLGAAQMGAIEFHIWGSANDKLDRPDRMVFDLDPDEGLGFEDVKAAAQETRAALEGLGLPATPMVTGGKGVHVIVPLRRIAGWDTVKGFSQTFATVMAQKNPERYVATMSKAKRKGRIFIDWLRNQRGATAVAPYSLRARTGAPVAVPVTWDELAKLKAANLFTPKDMKKRLTQPCPLLECGKSARGIGKEVVGALGDWAED
ncbi:DNA ligase D [Tranquillimonas alkanivorans]|uniref:DNA ligase (ATP) n=1 Tax=Tranquillimonas alkanivorans TaxID=441119 RepID=A0A1I5MY38_9RHOB|nr:DNA ligase D [Tranquillimonas alkanivorans]SFP14448.1 ATP-dependent DNA ligase LigD phosphoesterase module /ATP-dependent DNA ligase LigD polymerase module [Tranquillimonas alkanivorans]